MPNKAWERNVQQIFRKMNCKKTHLGLINRDKKVEIVCERSNQQSIKKIRHEKFNLALINRKKK